MKFVHILITKNMETPNTNNTIFCFCFLLKLINKNWENELNYKKCNNLNIIKIKLKRIKSIFPYTNNQKKKKHGNSENVLERNWGEQSRRGSAEEKNRE